MLHINGKEISGIYLGKKVITAVYKGALLVWSAVNSCFGKGRWKGKKPWKGKDKWRYNTKRR